MANFTSCLERIKIEPEIFPYVVDKEKDSKYIIWDELPTDLIIHIQTSTLLEVLEPKLKTRESLETNYPMIRPKSLKSITEPGKVAQMPIITIIHWEYKMLFGENEKSSKVKSYVFNQILESNEWIERFPSHYHEDHEKNIEKAFKEKRNYELQFTFQSMLPIYFKKWRDASASIFGNVDINVTFTTTGQIQITVWYPKQMGVAFTLQQLNNPDPNFMMVHGEEKIEQMKRAYDNVKEANLQEGIRQLYLDLEYWKIKSTEVAPETRDNTIGFLRKLMPTMRSSEHQFSKFQVFVCTQNKTFESKKNVLEYVNSLYIIDNVLQNETVKKPFLCSSIKPIEQTPPQIKKPNTKPEPIYTFKRNIPTWPFLEYSGKYSILEKIITENSRRTNLLKSNFIEFKNWIYLEYGKASDETYKKQLLEIWEYAYKYDIEMFYKTRKDVNFIDYLLGNFKDLKNSLKTNIEQMTDKFDPNLFTKVTEKDILRTVKGQKGGSHICNLVEKYNKLIKKRQQIKVRCTMPLTRQKSEKKH